MLSSNKQVKHLGWATVIAFILIPMSGFAVDIYVPSLPVMAVQLGVAPYLVQMTISVFLVSYGVVQFFVGGVLDRYGRYLAVLYALFVFSIAAMLIACSHSIYLIIFYRLLQGIALGVFAVGIRAFFVDSFSGKQLHSYMSLFSVAWSVGPIIAPFIGGYLETSFGWRSNFIFLAILALVLGVLYAYVSGETIKTKHPLSIRSVTSSYIEMVLTPQFSLGVLVLGLMYGMVMLYNMSGPFILEHILGKSPVETGYVSLFIGFAWMLGGLLNKALLDIPKTIKINIAISCQFIFVMIMLMVGHYITNFWWMICLVFLINATAGVIFNMLFAYCLGYFPAKAATSGGLVGGGVYLMTSFSSYSLVKNITINSQFTLGVAYFILYVCAFIIIIYLNKSFRKVI